MGDLKLVERPQAYTLAPGAQQVRDGGGGLGLHQTGLAGLWKGSTGTQLVHHPAAAEIASCATSTPHTHCHAPSPLPAVHPRQHQGVLHRDGRHLWQPGVREHRLRGPQVRCARGGCAGLWAGLTRARTAPGSFAGAEHANNLSAHSTRLLHPPTNYPATHPPPYLPTRPQRGGAERHPHRHHGLHRARHLPRRAGKRRRRRSLMGPGVAGDAAPAVPTWLGACPTSLRSFKAGQPGPGQTKDLHTWRVGALLACLLPTQPRARPSRPSRPRSSAPCGLSLSGRTRWR